MLDQLVTFADGIRARSIIVSVDKSTGQIRIQAEGARQEVQFNVGDLRKSNGGVLNDWTAQNLLNKQLK